MPKLGLKKPARKIQQPEKSAEKHHKLQLDCQLFTKTIYSGIQEITCSVNDG